MALFVASYQIGRARGVRVTKRRVRVVMHEAVKGSDVVIDKIEFPKR